MRMTLPELPPALLRLLQEQPDPAHAVGVAELAAASALEVGVDPTTAYLAGWLHDVGKLAVPQDLLNACRPLTSAERLMIQAHPVEGESLVRRAWPDVSAEIVHAVRHHHERLDGQGYPDGRSSLPVLTMLVAAADVYDALTRDRCYRSAMEAAVAVEILRGAALSREVVEAVCRVSGTPGASFGGAAVPTGRAREIRVDAVAEQV